MSPYIPLFSCLIWSKLENCTPTRRRKTVKIFHNFHKSQRIWRRRFIHLHFVSFHFLIISLNKRSLQFFTDSRFFAQSGSQIVVSPIKRRSCFSNTLSFHHTIFFYMICIDLIYNVSVSTNLSRIQRDHQIRFALHQALARFNTNTVLLNLNSYNTQICYA